MCFRDGADSTGHGKEPGRPTTVKVRAVDGRRLEIDGRVYDLDDPEERKAAVRAWLRAKAEGRRQDHPEWKDTGEATGVEGTAEEGQGELR